LDFGDNYSLDVDALMESLHSNAIQGKAIYIGIGYYGDPTSSWEVAKSKGWEVRDGHIRN
jgi:hypothetical protein